MKKRIITRYVKLVSLWAAEKVKFIKNFFQSGGTLAKGGDGAVGNVFCF